MPVAPPGGPHEATSNRRPRQMVAPGTRQGTGNRIRRTSDSLRHLLQERAGRHGGESPVDSPDVMASLMNSSLAMV